MQDFKFETRESLARLTTVRPGEVKMGERVQTISSFEDLSSSSAKYVILAIPEDVGIRANHGVGGAKNTWKPALDAFLNTQSNEFLSGDEIIVAGAFEIEDNLSADISVLRGAVGTIDALVRPVIEQITSAGKIPVVIGGGHNNAYPILAGVAGALKKKISVLNIDAHADLRPTDEGRHSGNGFSAAISAGVVSKYGIFGLQKAYNNQVILDKMSNDEKITGVWFENLAPDTLRGKWEELVDAMPGDCGLEVDMDSMRNMLSSAISPSGFSLDEVRCMVSTRRKFAYLHICEGAAEMSDGRKDLQVAKAISFLIRDFLSVQRTL